MKCHYDEWGRLDTLVGPNELSANKPYTIAMRYHPYLSSGEHHVTDPSSYAVTFHYDIQHPTNPIQTILFCDGLGRLIQTKKDAEVAGTPKLLNSGRVEYDCFGRTIGQYHPFSSSLSDTVYNAYFDPATLTSSTYDILDRPLKVKLPTHDSTCTAYGFDSHNGKTYFRTTTTDANGISVSVLTGTRKQQVKTIAPLNAVTTFTYDALGQLLQSTDPCHHSTTYTYDMLGRLVSRTHPDAGTDTYIYDGAGNMTKHATQILSNENKTIDYYYTYNRLDSVIYPDNPQNNVRYTYGDSTAGNNQRGRIALLEDASGFQTFKYGRMGEVIENNRTFVLPNERYPYSFKMKYTYDSWNRVQDITYPDGEVVHYKYNTGGMLRQVQGQRSFFSGLDSVIIGPFDPLNPREDEYDDPTADNAPNGGTMGDRSEYHNYTYDYINDIQYNEFELKSAILYGNGTSAQYSYDILNRLSRLKLYDAANNYLQNITYSYDAVGNIDAIQNTADRISGSNLGGTYTYTYKYDDLYRLTTAIGSTNIRVRATESTGSTRIQYASYTQRMRYDKDGKILSKSQISRTSLNGSDTYSNTANDYIYNSGQPHTVRATSASEFSWDANGNMIEQDAARMSWDEENQLREYSNRRSLAVAFYQYDAGGERFYKNTGERTTLVVNGRRVEMPYYHIPTLYTSPYLVATPQGYTKHYFMESERFASRIGDGTITNINNHVTTDAAIAAKQAQANAYAPDSIQTRLFERLRALPFNWSSHHTTYWQHSDHLGSASWITDTNGLGYQYLQYMAWGEPLVDQRRSGANYEARFTFSGKERDEESGFCYFGARLHNPALSLWLSVDPMSDKYPGESPYAYCGDNPILLKDPDGREKLIFFNTSSEQDFDKWRTSYNLTYAAHLLPENPEVIYLWAHGVTRNILKGIDIADENGPRSFLYAGGQLAEFLKTESNVFQANLESGQCSILVMYSCQTGQEGHIAQQTSANANLLVIAPTTNVQVDALYGENISLAADGKWAVYYKGEFMDYMPNPNVNNSKKTIEYYDNMYNTRHPDIDIQ